MLSRFGKAASLLLMIYNYRNYSVLGNSLNVTGFFYPLELLDAPVAEEPTIVFLLLLLLLLPLLLYYYYYYFIYL